VHDDHRTLAPQMWSLPSRELDGLWETLLFEDAVKQRLLKYVTTAMRFADAGVNPKVIGWNRVALLHGPPGTGKTSLCKALAHKLAIRLSARYPQSQLLEVRARAPNLPPGPRSATGRAASVAGERALALLEVVLRERQDRDGDVRAHQGDARGRRRVRGGAHRRGRVPHRRAPGAPRRPARPATGSPGTRWPRAAEAR